MQIYGSFVIRIRKRPEGGKRIVGLHESNCNWAKTVAKLQTIPAKTYQQAVEYAKEKWGSESNTKLNLGCHCLNKFKN